MGVKNSQVVATLQGFTNDMITRMLIPPAGTTSWDPTLVDLEKAPGSISFCHSPPNAGVFVPSCFLTGDVVCVGLNRMRRMLTRFVFARRRRRYRRALR
jgi:hypothetical protein